MSQYDVRLRDPTVLDSGPGGDVDITPTASAPSLLAGAIASVVVGIVLATNPAASLRAGATPTVGVGAEVAPKPQRRA